MKKILCLAMLLPSFVQAQGVLAELETQTVFLEQLATRSVYEGLGYGPTADDNCDRVHLIDANKDLIIFENTFAEPSVFSVALVDHLGVSNQRSLTKERATRAEAVADLLAIFNDRNTEEFDFDDATVDETLNCLNLNELMFGIQTPP